MDGNIFYRHVDRVASSGAVLLPGETARKLMVGGKEMVVGGTTGRTVMEGPPQVTGAVATDLRVLPY